MSKLPDIKTNFPEWYQEVIYQAEMADQAPVRGCIIIRPYGNAVWELIKNHLDEKIKETGHENALFPLFIPESFFKKEAEHVEGFAPELAMVTHAGGKELAEPLVVRPTSETMIHFMFAKWIKSWRDLPLKINQWANVVRWEMRPRAFLRTTEFYWQEGHTAHATKEEAEEEVALMLNIYKNMAENQLAIPVITGRKSEGEKFPGAERTHTFEAFMPDGKALQMGTSHLLSQSFAHAFEMKFQDKTGVVTYPWLTSWGTTTRNVGAVIMTHGDSKGLVLPPQVAPYQVVIIPIYKTEEDRVAVLEAAKIIKISLPQVRVLIDKDDQKTPGNKFFHWELKGVPVRIEIGPRDLAQKQVVVGTRFDGAKKTMVMDDIAKEIPALLQHIQITMLDNARARLNSMRVEVTTLSEMLKIYETSVMQTGYCGGSECEKVLKQYALSIRCLLECKKAEFCFSCGKESIDDCIIARSY